MLPSADEHGINSVKVSESPRYLGMQEHIVLCPSPMHLLWKVCHITDVTSARVSSAGVWKASSHVCSSQWELAEFLKLNKEQQMQLCK